MIKEPYVAIERSIIKQFRKEIWRPFVKGLQAYEMIADGDRIAVCISGGKDSMLLAKCMQELKRHSKTNFELEFIVMDPGYNPANRRLIEENAALMNIPVQIDLQPPLHAVGQVVGPLLPLVRQPHLLQQTVAEFPALPLLAPALLRAQDSVQKAVGDVLLAGGQQIVVDRQVPEQADILKGPGDSPGRDRSPPGKTRGTRPPADNIPAGEADFEPRPATDIWSPAGFSLRPTTRTHNPGTDRSDHPAF